MIFLDDDRQKFLQAAKVFDGIWRRPVNVNLLEIGERKILFDVGSGLNFLPTLGELPAALEAADVDISSITDVIFTHAHPDHIWGILDDFDDLLMPDAAYHISQAEWDFWDSDDAVTMLWFPGGRVLQLARNHVLISFVTKYRFLRAVMKSCPT